MTIKTIMERLSWYFIEKVTISYGYEYFTLNLSLPEDKKCYDSYCKFAPFKFELNFDTREVIFYID